MDSQINTFLRTSDPYLSRNSGKENTFLKEQERFLPIANVSKIMKKDLPLTAKVAKEAKECVQECASEFISFISSEAAENCQKEKRKTINGEDILVALANLGFDNYVEPLLKYLQKYREINKFENSLIEMNTAVCGSDTNWSLLNSTKVNNCNIRQTNFNIPKIISMWPLTDLNSNNLNLEGLFRDSDFQRAVLKNLKMPNFDEDSDCIDDTS